MCYYLNGAIPRLHIHICANLIFPCICSLCAQWYTQPTNAQKKISNEYKFTDCFFFLSISSPSIPFQSYATLSRGNKSVTTCSPVNNTQPAIQLPMGVSLLSPNNHHHNTSLVTSSLSEYRFRPEVVTTSNRIQESCI